MSRYLVIFEQVPGGGWSAYVPDLPGCFTLGDTQEETTGYIREAIAGHLALLQERGEVIPEPTVVAAELVEVA